MKIITPILGFLIAATLWVILPFFFIGVNQYFDLPIISFGLFKSVGLIFILIAIITDLYLLGLFKNIGNGTPVPINPTKKLIAQGLYKKTRNPMYISHFVLVFGQFLFFGHLALLICLVCEIVGLHLFVTLWEEPDLKRRLGSSYEHYLQEVPRWL